MEFIIGLGFVICGGLGILSTVLGIRMSGLRGERDRMIDVCEMQRQEKERSDRAHKREIRVLTDRLKDMKTRLAACSDPETIGNWLDDLLSSGTEDRNETAPLEDE